MSYTETDFHAYIDSAKKPIRFDGSGGELRWFDGLPDTYLESIDFNFDINLHSHPYISELVKRLVRGSVDGLQSADTEKTDDFDNNEPNVEITEKDYQLYEEFFDAVYEPTALVSNDNSPVEKLDFNTDGPYSIYNWELFFHVPMTIAIHLSKNKRFEQAMRWFHFIFDPTDDSDGPTPERFWKVKPFETTEPKMIEEIITSLARGQSTPLDENTMTSINAWESNPFQPHVVARYRHTSYMLKTVMAYLDNLIAWGDSLFRQDTIESINEATQLYVLASNILGPRPQEVPDHETSVDAKTYADIRQQVRSNDPGEEVENDASVNLMSDPGGSHGDPKFSLVATMSDSLYFCIPRNEKLIGYWDTVADRLFKIHNSLTLQGVFRQLPLYEPPIDPGAIAKAKAAGVDVASAVSASSKSRPQVRYQVLARKAKEICGEVKSLGSQLLQALEKEDQERLSAIRAEHERSILELTESVRYAQYERAKKSREGVRKSLEKAFFRYKYNERLLGEKADDVELPEVPDIDPSAIEGMDIDLSEPELDLRDVEIDFAKDIPEQAWGKGQGAYLSLNQPEARSMRKRKKAKAWRQRAFGMEQGAALAAILPDFGVKIQPLGGGFDSKFGGSFLSTALSKTASAFRFASQNASSNARSMSKIGNFSRREQRWAHQSRMAAQQVNQLFKRYRAAQIRELVAKKELENHRQRIQNAQEIEEFLTDPESGQTTNEDFYKWMKREVKGLHDQAYQLAMDAARKAERALQHELGDPEADFLDSGYRSGKQGLLAGEKLSLDLQRMDMAYHEQMEREYELTKHISLKNVAPYELIKLRATGSCEFEIPEEVFDMDVAGHYYRRINSVALSVPSLTGPQDSVNCTLRLQENHVRTTSTVGENGYAKTDEDDRFDSKYGRSDAIVTSSAQRDSGLFNRNSEEGKYLPFEGAGAFSNWRLELPDFESFDYDSIEDVVLHMEYTAREGGERLRNAATSHLNNVIAGATDAGWAKHMFSIRHDFPDAWSQFKQSSASNGYYELSLPLAEEDYPFWLSERVAGGNGAIEEATLVAEHSEDVTVAPDPSAPSGDTTTLSESIGGLREGIISSKPPLPNTPTDTWSMYLDKQAIDDVWAIVTVKFS